MARYFLALGYKGTQYAGFQIQQNAHTIQAAVEKAMQVYFRQPFTLTGSSRTDAGVHALQNYFHFDHAFSADTDLEKAVYHLNAILPLDIVVHSIREVATDAHCRFDAVSRSYIYTIHNQKQPFLQELSWYYPYQIDLVAMQQAAQKLQSHTDFESFCKRNTQVHTYNCTLFESAWTLQADRLEYHVRGNRFLRGMVRGLVGTMLQVGRGKLAVADLDAIIAAKNNQQVDFSAPAHGLMLQEVRFAEEG